LCFLKSCYFHGHCHHKHQLQALGLYLVCFDSFKFTSLVTKWYGIILACSSTQFYLLSSCCLATDTGLPIGPHILFLPAHRLTESPSHHPQNILEGCCRVPIQVLKSHHFFLLIRYYGLRSNCEAIHLFEPSANKFRHLHLNLKYYYLVDILRF
jgi:hypothetical protein